MRTSTFVRVGIVAASAALLWSACGGAGFEPSSKIKGLRVLALQKEPAYPHPGETVDLKLLYWDGKASDGSSRSVQFNFSQCDNPPGDLYYGCFAHGLAPLSTPPAPPADDAGTDASPAGDGGAPASDPHVVTRSLSIPPRDQIILKRDPTDYGLRYIFFTACAGHLGPVDPGGPNGLPIGCLDDNGQKLGPDDFVPGYGALYVYDTLRNANPVVAPDLEMTTPDPGPDGLRHVPRCTASDRGSCPSYAIKVTVDIDQSAETDPGAKDANGNPLKEQIWVAYYSTDGDFSSALRLVNDATTGPNLDHGTKFRAPPKPGTVEIFGVVHDNRGGVAWALGKLAVD